MRRFNGLPVKPRPVSRREGLRLWAKVRKDLGMKAK